MRGLLDVMAARRPPRVNIRAVAARLPDRSVQVGPTLVLLVILGLAAFLRLHDLTEFPPALHVDEAAQGINGLAVIEGDASLLRLGFTHHLNSAFLVTGAVLKLFGATVWSLRGPEAAFGIAAVLLTYLLGRSMFSWPVGLVGAFLLAVNHFAIAFSRIGLVNQQAMTVEVLAFFLLWKGFKEERRLLVFLGGAAAATGLYLYFGAWIVPPILGGFCLWMAALHRRGAWRYWRLATWGLLGFLLFVVPWLSFPILNAEEFHERPNEVFILSDLDDFKDYWRTDSTLEVLWQQTKDTVEFVYKGGDTSNQYGYNDPFFDPVSLWLFVAGVGIALVLCRRGRYAFLLIWVAMTLVFGGILTDRPPFAPRLLGMFPALALLAAVGLVKPIELLLRLAPSRRRTLAVAGLPLAITLIVAFSFYWNYEAYFQKYPEAPYTIYWPWIEPHGTLGRYLESLPGGSQAYVFRTPHVHASHPVVQFFTYDDEVDVQDVRCGATECPIPPPQNGEMTAYVFVPEMLEFLPRVKDEHPGGSTRSFSGRSNWAGDESLLFVAYRIDK